MRPRMAYAWGASVALHASIFLTCQIRADVHQPHSDVPQNAKYTSVQIYGDVTKSDEKWEQFFDQEDYASHYPEIGSQDWEDMQDYLHRKNEKTLDSIAATLDRHKAGMAQQEASDIYKNECDSLQTQQQKSDFYSEFNEGYLNGYLHLAYTESDEIRHYLSEDRNAEHVATITIQIKPTGYARISNVTALPNLSGTKSYQEFYENHLLGATLSLLPPEKCGLKGPLSREYYLLNRLRIHDSHTEFK